MSKIALELNIREVKNLVDQLPLNDKIQLLRELQKESWAKRLKRIFQNIDARRRKHKLSVKTISQEIEKARRAFYARRD